ncbi:MAG: SLBB domain-containing protein [Syntrophales bacterium]|nr:SLBB domain-containing protein [Syntrophales bacterium]
MTPEQRQAVQAELVKSGGRLTPEAIEALRNRPEFKGLSPEDIAKGKRLLDQKEKQQEKKPLSETEKETISTEEPAEKSVFDRSRRIGKYQDIKLKLNPFGAEFFSSSAIKVSTERRDIPVPLKYVVGPGDEVKLLFWGRVNAQYNLTVDRDGKITIPQIGPLFVAGKTFEDLSKDVIKQSEQIVGANVDITLGSLKTIPIFILGDIQRPGAYTIGSSATITDALLLAGGPTGIGSMRNVQLRRKGQLVTTFDLYDLLLKGDKSKDVPLMAGDVVFVPITGPLAGIAGNVKRPAIYELRDRYDLENLINLAGGIIPIADTQQIQVERIIRGERQVVVDINDKNLDKAVGVKLQDADLVKIFSIVDKNTNAIYLNGNVKRPGMYELRPGLKISDLIKAPTDLMPETYFDYALIKRLNPPAMEPTLVPFNLGDIISKKDPKSDIELKAQDQIYIFNVWFFKDKPSIYIEGEIRGECTTEQSATDQGGRQERTSADALANIGQERAIPIAILGGKQERASLDMTALAAEFKNMEDDLKKQGVFDVANLIRDAGIEAQSVGRVQPESLRLIRSGLAKAGRNELADRISDIESRMKNACQIRLIENMNVKDAILMAGGLTKDSYLERGEIIRKDDDRNFKTLYFNVTRALAGVPVDNPPLQKDDRIIIHSIWEKVYKKNVIISGEVAKPGIYQYTDGMTVRDLVFKGGNILESAYFDEAEVSSTYAEGGKTIKNDRRVINLKKALDGDAANNIPLRPNDRLLVKPIPEWGAFKYVTLTGEFKFPGQYVIQKGERLSSVIERAGGYTSLAYLRASYFTRETVKQLQQKSIEEMAKRMERELQSEGATRVASSVSADELKSKQVELEMKQKLIETIRQLKATGRMTIVMTHLRMLKGSAYDIELEDGDAIFLPRKNSVVNVAGAVMSESSHIYSDNLDYRDYISLAGGPSRYADEGNIFVIKVDGSARKLSRGMIGWSDRRARWEFAEFGQVVKEIEPGDVIVVPEKIATIAWLREIRDITQILMNTAVVAGVTIKLF